jgi:hypothetical protein
MTNITDMTADALNRALAEEMGKRPVPDSLDMDCIKAAIKSSYKGQIVEQGRIRVVYEWNGQKWDFPLTAGMLGGPSDGVHALMWEQRTMGEYCADIEAHMMECAWTPPDYCGDLQTAFNIGAEMRKRGLSGEFCKQLLVVVDSTDEPDSLLIYAIAHAAPRQRAEAALAALRGRVTDAP